MQTFLFDIQTFTHYRLTWFAMDSLYLLVH